jgi:MFS family permease
VVHAGATIAVGLTSSFWVAVSLYLVAMAAVGVFTPVNQAYLHAVIPSEQRATVLSLSSLAASVGSMGGQAGLGWLAASRSLGTGYIAGGVAAAFAVPLILSMRRLNGDADRIKGTAGRFAACETLAIPVRPEALAARDPV